MNYFAKTTGIAVAAALFLSTASSLHAMATLRVSANAGVNWLKVRDTDGDGSVSFAGSIGGWSVSLAAGTTKPAVGSATDPIMNLSGANISSTGLGTLLIEYTETFYGPLPEGNYFKLNLQSDNVGTGRTTMYSYLGQNNTIFEYGTLLGVVVETGANQSSLVAGQSLYGYGQFSLTTRIAIRHTGAQVSSFSATLVDPSLPEGGATVTFLGVSLLSLGALARYASRRAESLR